MSFSFVFCPLSPHFFFKERIVHSQPAKREFSSRCLCPHFYSQIFSHTHTHACTYTHVCTHTLSSSLAFTVQHHLFLTIVSPASPFPYHSDLHIPAQCSPELLRTPTRPSTFLCTPVQCGHPMWEAPAVQGAAHGGRG